MHSARAVIFGLVVTAVVSPGCRTRNVAPPPATAESPAGASPSKRVVGPLSEADATALATMNDRLNAYVQIHSDLEKGLPKVPKEATPQQIDAHRRTFEQKMQDARKDAKPGEIFTAEAAPVIKRLLASVFAGPEGKQMRASIMDDQPTGIKLVVNGRYPDNVPVSTVPPEVLQTLPKLSEDMEYRFIGRHLILLDTHAHVIADYIENAVPPR